MSQFKSLIILALHRKQEWSAIAKLALAWMRLGVKTDSVKCILQHTAIIFQMSLCYKSMTATWQGRLLNRWKNVQWYCLLWIKGHAWVLVYSMTNSCSCIVMQAIERVPVQLNLHHSWSDSASKQVSGSVWISSFTCAASQQNSSQALLCRWSFLHACTLVIYSTHILLICSLTQAQSSSPQDDAASH